MKTKQEIEADYRSVCDHLRSNLDLEKQVKESIRKGEQNEDLFDKYMKETMKVDDELDLLIKDMETYHVGKEKIPQLTSIRIKSMMLAIKITGMSLASTIKSLDI